MGRRKIEIEYIRDDRSRATTFIKRKSGLFKKAHELSVLTGAQVCVIVFSQQDRLFTYGSDEAVNIVDKFTGAGTAYEAKGPQDFGGDGPGDDEGSHDEDDSFVESGSSRRDHTRTGSGIPPSPHLGRRSSVQGVGASPRLSPRVSDGRAGFNTADRKRAISPRSVQDSSPKSSKREAETSSRRISPMPMQAHLTQGGRIAPPPIVTNQDNFSQQESYTQQQQQQQHQERYSEHQQQHLMVPHRIMPHPHPYPPSLQMSGRHLPPMSYSPQQSAPMNSSGQHQNQDDSLATRQQPLMSPNIMNMRSTMGPPLAIPHSVPSMPHPSQAQQGQDSLRVQPLLPPGSSNLGSRILLSVPEQVSQSPLSASPSGYSASTPTMSIATSAPSANTPSTNVQMPKISTDVGHLFYNWNTGEPGLSPATQFNLNQMNSSIPNSAGPGAQWENYSPTTQQWLLGESS